MFKAGERRGSVISPIKPNSARYQIWERLKKGHSPESIKQDPPKKENGLPTLESNIDIEVDQFNRWEKYGG